MSLRNVGENAFDVRVSIYFDPELTWQAVSKYRVKICIVRTSGGLEVRTPSLLCGKCDVIFSYIYMNTSKLVLHLSHLVL